jgi:hypothetical protein
MHSAETAQEREHLRKALIEAQKAHDASSPMSALRPKADIRQRILALAPPAPKAVHVPPKPVQPPAQ